MLYVIGNWKMAPEKQKQVVDLIKKTNEIAKQNKKTLTVIACPPAVFIPLVVKSAKAPLLIGTQGVAASDAIAQTGLVSAGMIKDIGAQYCIIGHSEMRARGDGNDYVKKQLSQLLEKKIVPIVCIGEKSRDSQGWYLSEVKEQLESVFADLAPLQAKKIIVAYEPVWAIGKNAQRAATPAECLEMIIFIRKMLTDKYDEKTAKSVAVLYGGSADEFNAQLFIDEGGAQGFLVGRVSLDGKRLAALAKAIA